MGNGFAWEEGTPQGGSASPLLANVYLHCAFSSSEAAVILIWRVSGAS
jgi:retron-type reverse transcriptase